MKKNISANECKSMFNDKFSTLNMKEIGIELKHFSMGTAPENPSFLVNQDDLKKKIVEKFCDFFDENKSKGLEVIFLKSNYGNGKSHFIRMIYTFLNEYENVIARKVSLKQEETDLKKKILESISQKKLKECATFLVDSAMNDALSDEKDAVLLSISEKYSVGTNLSLILYEAARSEDISKQVQAIAILKGNYLPSYLKTFGCKSKGLSSEFFYDVIKLISVYLKEKKEYLVVVFDEYEHVFSWKSNAARKSLYEDIKLFTDNIDTFGNLFFVFAESISAENQTESMDDPAFVSRKANLTYQISDISSENEVNKLLKMILKRYQKYYAISLEEYVDDILELVNEDALVKTKTNYRGYTQTIMKVLDQFRNKPPRIKKDNGKIESNKTFQGEMNSWILKWKKSTSISKKTMLCEILEQILVKTGENIISQSKKRGEYITESMNIKKKYFVVCTDNPSLRDLEKRYRGMVDKREKDALLYVLYPVIEEQIDIVVGDKLVFYDENTVDMLFRAIYDTEKKYDSIDSYFEILNKRSNNAEEN